MLLAIHQPNFIPWQPFFEKMRAADKFVILTYCQFNREHYQHRFQHEQRWYTMGVQNVRHPDLIRNRVYAKPQEDWQAIKRRLPAHAAWFSQFDDLIEASLWRTNYQIILRLAEKLGIARDKNQLEEPTSLTGTDRLIDLCVRHGATRYLAGRSGAAYMDFQKFTAANIEIVVQDVKNPNHLFVS